MTEHWRSETRQSSSEAPVHAEPVRYTVCDTILGLSVWPQPRTERRLLVLEKSDPETSEAPVGVGWVCYFVCVTILGL